MISSRSPAISSCCQARHVVSVPNASLRADASAPNGAASHRLKLDDGTLRAIEDGLEDTAPLEIAVRLLLIASDSFRSTSR